VPYDHFGGARLRTPNIVDTPSGNLSEWNGSTVTYPAQYDNSDNIVPTVFYPFTEGGGTYTTVGLNVGDVIDTIDSKTDDDPTGKNSVGYKLSWFYGNNILTSVPCMTPEFVLSYIAAFGMYFTYDTTWDDDTIMLGHMDANGVTDGTYFTGWDNIKVADTYNKNIYDLTDTPYTPSVDPNEKPIVSSLIRQA
jgi:hypothetical protein